MFRFENTSVNKSIRKAQMFPSNSFLLSLLVSFYTSQNDSPIFGELLNISFLKIYVSV